MLSKWGTVHFLIGLYVLTDIYTFFGLKTLVPKKLRWVYIITYILFSIYIYFGIYTFYQLLDGGSIFRRTDGTFYIGLFFTVLVGKLIFTLLMLLQDISRLFWGSGGFLKRLITQTPRSEEQSFFPRRRKLVTGLATLLAGIPFSGMLYGITKGKYRYTVNNVKLAFKDLPPAFDGFKIVQISDIHAGSLDSESEVAKGVRMINEQNPDVILFTGDLINSQPDEVDPFIKIFKELTAKIGKFASLGNHDYYGLPRDASDEQEAKYMQHLATKFEAMDFQLLNNKNIPIERSDSRICMLGVENWGKGRWFPKRGDIDQALENTTSEEFCILLSHDPTHWDEKVLPHPKKIHLTLSGHTHGFQFGINMPGFKWSPAQYRYPRFMGLYEAADQYLYVNQGFGYLAFPGRVGIWPEITVIELTSSS